MIIPLKKYSTVILILLVLLLLVTAWFYPSLGLMLGTILLVLTLGMVCITIIQKHRKSHLQGTVAYPIFIQNVILEIGGILLAAACAAYFGNYIALLATRSIGDIWIRFAAGIFVGLLVGLVIGALLRRLWSRFLLQQMK